MGALDLTLADPFDLFGAGAGAVTFSAGATAGDTIVTLRTGRCEAFGGAVFSTYGTVPAQLALSGNRIVRGAGAATPGTVYLIGIRVDAVDGEHSAGGVTLGLRAS